MPISRSWLVALALSAGCATTGTAQTTTTTTTTSSSPPPVENETSSKKVAELGLIGTDVKRIEEIAQLDHKNQVQAQQVRTLEKQVTDLEARLSAALNRGVDQKGTASASAASETTFEGGRVRVRLSGELVFEPNSARISRAGRKALKEVARVLKETPAKRIEIAGHTDNLPTSKKYEDNWQLAGERAHRVVRLLAEEGVDPHHLVAVGYGDTSPLDPADTAEARAKNRRVEIFIEPTREGTPPPAPEPAAAQ